jgi:hypothetical protein
MLCTYDYNHNAIKTKVYLTVLISDKDQKYKKRKLFLPLIMIEKHS